MLPLDVTVMRLGRCLDSAPTLYAPVTLGSSFGTRAGYVWFTTSVAWELKMMKAGVCSPAALTQKRPVR
jgi:hypothetical protein